MNIRFCGRLEAAVLWASPLWHYLPGIRTPSWWVLRVVCCSDAPSLLRCWPQFLPKARVWPTGHQRSLCSDWAAAPSTQSTAPLSTGKYSAQWLISCCVNTDFILTYFVGRNLFVSAGTDGLAHIHSLLQTDPLLSVRVSESYVLQVQWSPSRPLVFAAATAQGTTWDHVWMV